MSHPENRFIQTIHRRLKPFKRKKPTDQGGIYYAKLQVSGNNGWPDCYYSGACDLWVEYKWVPESKFPTRDESTVKINLSANQRNWLTGRHHEGRNVCVIVGSPNGHVILRCPLPETIRRGDFMSSAIDTDQVVQYILAELSSNTGQSDRITLPRKGSRHEQPSHHAARSG